MSKRVNTEQFIARAKARHGDRYDYSRAEYVGATKPITIICQVHGEFQQRPANHYLGAGCRECARNKPLSREVFIARAHLMHGNRYDYSSVEISGIEGEVRIGCAHHGIFLQRANVHLKGYNCPSCGQQSKAKKLTKDLQIFIDEARKIHGDLYDYSAVKYLNGNTKVRIFCPAHGPFMQRPQSHLLGIGCSECGHESAGKKRRLTKEEFIQRAKSVHGDKYDYSESNYSTGHEKIKIYCPVHGPFWQSAVNHTMGNRAGCPGCAVSGFDQTKAAILYYIAVDTDQGETLYKIGITNLSIERRFPVVDRMRIRVLHTWNFSVGADAASRELEILKQYSEDLYAGPAVLMGAGNTELFVRDILALDLGSKRESFRQWTQLRLD